jgi:hypothetical protein
LAIRQQLGDRNGAAECRILGLLLKLNAGHAASTAVRRDSNGDNITLSYPPSIEAMPLETDDDNQVEQFLAPRRARYRRKGGNQSHFFLFFSVFAAEHFKNLCQLSLIFLQFFLVVDMSQRKKKKRKFGDGESGTGTARLVCHYGCRHTLHSSLESCSSSLLSLVKDSNDKLTHLPILVLTIVRTGIGRTPPPRSPLHLHAPLYHAMLPKRAYVSHFCIILGADGHGVALRYSTVDAMRQEGPSPPLRPFSPNDKDALVRGTKQTCSTMWRRLG